MRNADQKSMQMARKSAQTARQNYQRAQNQHYADQRAMQQPAPVSPLQKRKPGIESAALVGAGAWGCCIGFLGFMLGGPVAAAIGALIGILIGPKIIRRSC